MTAVFMIVAVFVLAAIPSVLYLSVSKRRGPVTLTILAGIPFVLSLCAATYIYFEGGEHAGMMLGSVWWIARIPLVLVAIAAVLYLCVSKGKSPVAQSRQKPPLSVGRIAGEILAGAVTGFAVAVPVLYATLCVIIRTIWREEKNLGLGGFVVLGFILLAFPIVYGPASAIGVYLVGRRGTQAGSFPATLGWGFLGGIVMAPMFLPLAYVSWSWLIGVEKTVLWALVLLIPPGVTTLGFNRTRSYKEPVLPRC